MRLTATDDIDQVVSKEIMISITHETPVVKIDITDKNLIVTPDHVNTVTLDGAETSLVLDLHTRQTNSPSCGVASQRIIALKMLNS